MVDALKETGETMKGVLLAGGTGSRLLPLTRVTNKHLLPIYNKPMIYHPLEKLKETGIKDILIISGREHCGHILNVLGSGKEMGLSLSYEIQEEAGGIAQALSLAEEFAKGQSIAVILGDNIFEDSLKIIDFKEGAKVFIKEVPDAYRFGVAEIKDGKIISLEEKPKNPKSSFITTGFYLYDNKVFDIIRTLKPSARGELEITEVNSIYLSKGELTYEIIQGYWSDSGTLPSLFRAGLFIALKEAEKRNDPLLNQILAEGYSKFINMIIRKNNQNNS